MIAQIWVEPTSNRTGRKLGVGPSRPTAIPGHGTRDDDAVVRKEELGRRLTGIGLALGFNIACWYGIVVAIKAVLHG